MMHSIGAWFESDLNYCLSKLRFLWCSRICMGRRCNHTQKQTNANLLNTLSYTYLCGINSFIEPHIYRHHLKNSTHELGI